MPTTVEIPLNPIWEMTDQNTENIKVLLSRVAKLNAQVTELTRTVSCLQKAVADMEVRNRKLDWALTAMEERS